MKTPTIIVRLIGIYLLATSIVGLIQIGRQESMQVAMQQQMQETIRRQTIPGLPSQQMPQIQKNPVLDDMQIYWWIGVVIGSAATGAAGFLARLLTFDADSRSGSDDFSDGLLRH